MMESLPQRDQFTVGWICALPVELAVARAMLDQKYPSIQPAHAKDTNTYFLGRVGEHKVVIVGLGSYGTTSAAVTATNLLSSFPKIRFGLLVGVGGGVPSDEHDVRLGDIVVSKPQDTYGGVVQVDMGKETSTGFQRTGMLNRPPTLLLGALTSLESEHMLGELEKIPAYMLEVLSKHPNLGSRTKHPGVSSDKLFCQDYDHSDSSSSCHDCDVSKLVYREARNTDLPFIHYGIIGSGNQVIKNARIRDQLRKDHGISCFEMEAAGIMNDFPSVVIRGICDYSDSHKTKMWQPYAALVAAAYAKEFLGMIHAAQVEIVPKASDILQGIQQVLQEVREDIREVTDNIQERKIYKWLSPPDPSENYNRAIRTRHVGSGTWFLQSENFKEWTSASSGKSAMWLHGSTGCGKTVLASSIIEQLQSEIDFVGDPDSKPILLFFYFDFSDDSKQSLDKMIRTLISQSCHQDGAILASLSKLRKEYGHGAAPRTEKLLDTFSQTFSPQRKTYVVIDALDECNDPRSDLLQWIQSFAEALPENCRLLVTSRGENDIKMKLGQARTMSQIISVQDGPIDEDIRSYIRSRIVHDDGLARWRLAPEQQLKIETTLVSNSKGMFRWAACQIDALVKCYTPLQLERALNTLPKTLYETYHRVLEDVPVEEIPEARRLLQFLAWTKEPLELVALADAISVDLSNPPYFDPTNRAPITSEVIGSCSSLVTVVNGPVHYEDQKTVRLAHASVQQYLTSNYVKGKWRKHLAEPRAKASNAKVCLAYCFGLTEHGQEADGLDHDEKYLDNLPFTDYSARNWSEYAIQAGNHDGLDSMIQTFLLREDLERVRLAWLRLKDGRDHLVPDRDWHTQWFRIRPDKLSPLSIASACGLARSVQSLLKHGARVDGDDPVWPSALYAAAYGGHDKVVQLLLKSGARPDFEPGWSELAGAAHSAKGFASMKVLLQHGADPNAWDESVGFPLTVAVVSGQKAIVQLLLENGAQLNAVDKNKKSALQAAIASEQAEIVEILLKSHAAVGLDVNLQGNPYGSPLIAATVKSFVTSPVGTQNKIVRMLLEKGADVDLQIAWGLHFDTALIAASSWGNTDIIDLLVENGADINLPGVKHVNALVAACESDFHRNPLVVEKLFEHGAVLNTHSETGYNALHGACMQGHSEIVQTLITRGADVNESRDCSASKFGLVTPTTALTPLLSVILSYTYARNDATFMLRMIEIMKLLVTAKVDVNMPGAEGKRPLHYVVSPHSFNSDLLMSGRKAARTHGSKSCDSSSEMFRAFADILTNNGADVNAQDAKGITPLMMAAVKGNLDLIDLFLKAGADLSPNTNNGWTVLHCSVYSCDPEIVKYFIDLGVDLNARDDRDRAAIVFTTTLDPPDMVEMLDVFLKAKADLTVPVQLYEGFGTMLHWAVQDDLLLTVQMLVDAGADLFALDSQGNTPLQLAESQSKSIVLEMGEIIDFLKLRISEQEKRNG